MKDGLLAFAEFKQSETRAASKDVVDTVPYYRTETVDEAGELSKAGVQRDKRESVEWENDTVEQFSVDSKDINFTDDEIENYSIRKSLSVELLEALSELSKDDSDQFGEEMLPNDQSDILEDSKNSGVYLKNSSKSLESKLYCKTPESIHEDKVVEIHDKGRVSWRKLLDNDQSDILEDSKDSGDYLKNSSKSLGSKLYCKTPEPIHEDKVVEIHDKIRVSWRRIKDQIRRK